MLVVHAHDLLLALGQDLDGRHQGGAHALVLQAGRRLCLGVAHVAVQKAVFVVALAVDVLEVDELRAPDLGQQVLVFGETQTQLLSDLGFHGCAVQLLLQTVHRLLDVLLALARTARHPVALAQLVDHRAADALAGESLKLHTLRRFESRNRLGQTDHADLDQIVHLHTGRQLGDHVVREAAHQGTVFAQLVVSIEGPFGGIHRHQLHEVCAVHGRMPWASAQASLR